MTNMVVEKVGLEHYSDTAGTGLHIFLRPGSKPEERRVSGAISPQLYR